LSVFIEKRDFVLFLSCNIEKNPPSESRRLSLISGFNTGLVRETITAPLFLGSGMHPTALQIQVNTREI